MPNAYIKKERYKSKFLFICSRIQKEHDKKVNLYIGRKD